MKTDELIALMAAETAPTTGGVVRRRLLAACLIGATATAGLLFLVKGPWQGLVPALGAGAFWMKAAYTLWLAAGGFWLADRAARPGARAGLAPVVVGAALVSMGALAGLNLAALPVEHWRAAWMGVSARVCPVFIIGAAAPVYAGVVLALRSLAPTRLALAGAAAGLLAGAVGASVYALWCRETAPLFVACWYTLGVAVCAGLGALLGPKVLRW